MKTRLFEIFTSIEGEGILYGTKTLFVRLAGCPYSCFYCDTLDALPLDSGKEYSINEACDLIDRNLQKNTYKVNFTGGEPLIQHEAVSELAKHVKSKGIPNIESNIKGDLLVHINIWTPEKLTQEQENFFKEHSSAKEFRPKPKNQKSFFEKVKEMFN